MLDWRGFGRALLLLLFSGLACTSFAQDNSNLFVAIQQAIKQKRLLEPPGRSAWESYERLRRSGAPQAQQKAAREALAAALKHAGEEILRVYLEARDPRARGGRRARIARRPGARAT